MKRVAVGAVVVAALLAAFVWRDTVAQLASFPWMASAYEAKEYCSCRFVEGRDAAFCDAFVAQDVVPSQGRVVDEDARRVTATALWLSSSARHVSDRWGCVLEQDAEW